MNKVIRFFTAAAVGFGLMGLTTSHAGTLPASSCALVGSIRTCNLWAKTGTLSLPGATVNIWGYTDSAAGTPTLPGPTLVVTQGEVINIVLTNNLAQATALEVQGVSMDEDLIGAAAGGSATYSFTASSPGTYVYEAGLTANGQKQVLMGLFGALIVRPSTPNTAYGSAVSAYDDEALIVLSEVDPAFNANPDTYNLWQFHPTYWLMNGKSYPDTVNITSKPGRKLLVRYINAGSETQSMGVLGVRENIIANDGKPLTFPYSVVAETIPAGETMDVIVSVPVSAQANSKFALMNAGLRNDNAGARTGAGSGITNFGGQLTFIAIPSDLVGPIASNVIIAPNSSDGTVNSLLTATIDDTTTGGNPVTAAEYFIDTAGAPGTGIPMTGAFGTVSVGTNVTVLTTTIRTLTAGAHTLFVRGKDAFDNWGALSSTILTVTVNPVDLVGPAITGLTLTPNATNSTGVVIQAVASDVATGNNNVTAAEYFVDVIGANGSGTAMTVLGAVAPTRNVSATAILSALSDGSHTVFVHALDAANNWGTPASSVVLVDKTGPTVSGLAVAPNPTNNATSVALTGSATDALSNISAAEWFTVPTTVVGGGNPLNPTDGAFNSLTEALTRTINVSSWPSGTVPIYVRARDVVGNWGVSQSVSLAVVSSTVDLIFANGFETSAGANAPWGWTSANGNTGGNPTIAVTNGSTAEGARKLAGTFRNTTGFVQDNTPVNEIAYHGRFYFNPNNATTTSNNNVNNGWQTLFSGWTNNNGNTMIFSVQFRHQSGGGNNPYQVRLTNGNSNSAAVSINNNTYNTIEVWFAGGNGGQIKMYVNQGNVNSPSSTLAVASNNHRVEMVRLGRGVNDGFSVNGTEYFDRFESARNRFIGP